MSEYEEEINVEEVEKIKMCKIEDFMDCKETRDILFEDWNESYEERIVPGIKSIYIKHHNYLQKYQNSNILKESDDKSLFVLKDLIKHNIEKEYSRKPFVENPDLAKNLIIKLENIRDEKRRQHDIYLKNKIDKSLIKYKSKNFKWSELMK